jgi:DNA polymerase-3 subunit alpha
MDRLREEFEAIGFYLSAHPLDAYGKTLARLGVQPVVEVLAEGRSGSVSLAGTVIAKKERTSGRGSRFAFVQLSDASGVFEVTVFSEVLAAHRDLLEVGKSLHIKATAQFDGEGVRFTVQSLALLAEVAGRTSPGLKLCLRSVEPLSRIHETLSRGGGGRGRVQLLCGLEDGSEVQVVLPEGYAVSPAVLFEMRDIPGVLAAEEI